MNRTTDEIKTTTIGDAPLRLVEGECMFAFYLFSAVDAVFIR